MKASSLTSQVLLHATKLLDQLRNEAAQSLTAPEGLSNEKTSQWFDKQNAINSFYITNLLGEYFSGEKSSAKKRLDALGLLKKAEDIEPGQRAIVCEGAIANLQCKVSAVPQSIDRESVRSRLTAVHGFSEEDAQKFIEAVTKTKAPSRTIEVVQNVG